nr:integrase, catalytic region, zinc finger, CCHC-type, peptidase aspartic, catalytic [Tanacetum cinerariifolium]
MSNMSEDIQYAGSDTRPPMFDKIDYESWQKRICLYCLGKDNGENIMKSIVEGPYQMGTKIETLARGVEGALQLGPEQIDSFQTLHKKKMIGIWDNVKMLREGSELTKDDQESQLYDEFEHFRQNKEENIHSYYRPQDSDYFKDKMLLMQAQENGAVLDEKQLLFLVGEQVTNFDDDVDDPPEQDLALNVDHVFEADQYSVYEHHDVHEKQNNVQQDYIADSDADYTSDGNIIPYDQYVKDNAEQVVQRNVSSVQNDALNMIIDDMHEQGVQKQVNERRSNNLEKRILQKKKDKLLEEFIDIKALKENVEDRLFKQDQSVQTVHILCKPKPFYDEKKKVAIGYKNSLCLTRAKQIQHALYNGNEIVRTIHARAVVYDSEDTLEIAEITRKKCLKE